MIPISGLSLSLSAAVSFRAGTIRNGGGSEAGNAARRRQNTDACGNEKPVSASEVYGTIEDVMTDLPDFSYKDMIRAVGREYDMYPRELEKKYKRSRSVYEKAKRFAQEIQARIAKRDTPKPSGQRE